MNMQLARGETAAPAAPVRHSEHTNIIPTFHGQSTRNTLHDMNRCDAKWWESDDTRQLHIRIYCRWSDYLRPAGGNRATLCGWNAVDTYVTDEPWPQSSTSTCVCAFKRHYSALLTYVMIESNLLDLVVWWIRTSPQWRSRSPQWTCRVKSPPVRR